MSLTALCDLQLLDSCLKSPLLPAYLAVAFCKKLSRLALCVPPFGALAIALVHNLLQTSFSKLFGAPGTKKVSMIVSYWEDNAKIIRIDNDIFPSHQRVIDGK
ncbi:nucleolar complex 4 homolog, partial [Olea europaea subsp. europaea]